MTIEDVSEFVKMSQAIDRPCIMCGSPTRNRGIFVPDDPARAGLGNSPPGKQRCVIYLLCAAHTWDEYTLAAVEEMLRAELSNQG